MRHWGANKTEPSGICCTDNADNSNKPERNEREHNPFAALWTTLSGFESLPPSQFPNSLRSSELGSISRSMCNLLLHVGPLAVAKAKPRR